MSRPTTSIKEVKPRWFLRATLALCVSMASAFAAERSIVVLDLHGLACYACLHTVQKALLKAPGVEDTVIDWDKKTATVRFDSSKMSPQALTKVVANAGFTAQVRR